MKKIPTLFERIYENHKVIDITRIVTPGCEDAFMYGIPTIKRDGSCCAVINQELYKRYDARVGKRKPPAGAIPCCDPDPVTGHWPHWVKVDPNKPEDKWFVEAYQRTLKEFGSVQNATYEAIGLHFQGNPYGFNHDRLCMHGQEYVQVERTFEGVKRWLNNNNHEGIVFWLNGEPICKIKRTDFGFKWPV